MPLKVWGIMKLAVKYDVAMLRTIIARHFESDWPRTLAEWEKQDARFLSNTRLSECKMDNWDNNGTLISKTPIDYSMLPEPALAIRFAMEFNCPSILPAAFYHLSQVSPLTDWDIASRTFEPNNPPIRTRPSARWSMLEPPDVFRLLTGKDELHQRMPSELCMLWQACRAHCVNEEQDQDADSRPKSLCTKTLEGLILDRTIISPSRQDPLYTFRGLNDALGHHFVEEGGVIGAAQKATGVCVASSCNTQKCSGRNYRIFLPYEA